ncbi:MAG: acyl-ACP--UDP-N-acetylglucosamine O-acyltransferase [Phycisphaerales bacterium]
MGTRIHPTAVVDRRAELGDGVEIGAYCVIHAGAVLGEGCTLHNHVTVYTGVRMGRENVVYPHAVLGGDPQDRKYLGGETTLHIGDRNKFREQVTVHRGTEVGGGVTRVGSDGLFMVGSHIAHDCIIEDRVVIANGTMLGGHCLVEEGVGIGGAVGVHHFTTIGTLAFVGGMSRVVKDVPPYVVVEGAPAEPRKVNTTGLARADWTQPQVDEIRDAYRRLFEESRTASEVIAELRAAPHASPHIRKLCDALEHAHQGVYGRWREHAARAAEPRP